MYEVLHWPQTEMYDCKLKQGGLFTNYINTFLKIKQQASGLPETFKLNTNRENTLQAPMNMKESYYITVLLGKIQV